MKETLDVAIIGGGAAGLGAAIYCGRFRLKTILFAKEPGGLITWTHLVENYPGFISISGLELAQKLSEHAKANNIEMITDEVKNIEKQEENWILEVGEKKYSAKTILFATGTKVRQLGVPGEEEYKNRGVHYCAACDGAFYSGKTVAIIGGSDSAIKEALMMTEYAEKVYIIYRKDKLRAEPINLDRLKDSKKIEIIYNTNILEIKGEKTVNKVILDKEHNGSKELALDGIFVAIGHVALSDLAKKIGVETNEKGEIVINRYSKTNIPGIYAAGDVVDTSFKQAIVGVAEGVTAAFMIYEYLK